jgi:hypothetical protein
MSDSNDVPNFALICLRLAAECRALAADAPEPELRAHFLHTASMWTALADQPLVQQLADDTHACGVLSGNCGTVLLHAGDDQVHGLFIRCMQCEAFNATDI